MYITVFISYRICTKCVVALYNKHFVCVYNFFAWKAKKMIIFILTSFGGERNGYRRCGG